MEPTESLSCLICVFSYLINYSDSSDGLLYHTYYIREEQKPGTFIGNIAADVDIASLMSREDFKAVKYGLRQDKENEYNSLVSIDSNNSSLTVKSNIDREVICDIPSAFSCSITIGIFARNDEKGFFKRIEATIVIEDINDHSPYFKTPYFTFALSESDIVGNAKAIDSAVDNDSDNYSVKAYEIVPNDIPFRIEFNKNGEETEVKIVVSGKLDREKIDKYSFEIVATDGGVPPLNGSMQLEVTIDDVNDNRPVFDQDAYNVTVKENITVDTVILKISANDSDLGENGVVLYQLSSQQSQAIKEIFSINATSGELKVVKGLEYASGENVIKVKVQAQDKGNRPLTSTTIVTVTVEDLQNNPPEIAIDKLLQAGEEDAAISESAAVESVVAIVVVTDRDSGRNGHVECTSENDSDQQYFKLQSIDLNEYNVVVDDQQLDRESKASHLITITCHDFGIPQLNSSENFIVNIKDENDNHPVFSKQEYISRVKENNDEGAVIVNVFADDVDLFENGRVSYYIEPEDRKRFSINAKTGLITTNIVFDREIKAIYQFHVVAVDAGKDPLSASATIKVIIEDVNDNAPKFIKNPFTFHIPESDLKQTVFGKVFANDSDEPRNANITYSLIGNTSVLPFMILPDGTVKTTDKLDREKVPRYEFIVMATDNGQEKRLSSTADIIVTVEDINDHYPNIVYPSGPNAVKYITYMSPPKNQIMKIEAIDLDEGKNGELSYIIWNRNDSNMVEMGRNGEVYVARRMSINDVNTYVLQIEVSDQGTPPKSNMTRITIIVLAKNITSPESNETNLNSQNIIIAVVVVVVTCLLALAILVTIWVIQNRRKRKFANSGPASMNVDNDSGFSSTGGRKSPDALHMLDNGLVPTSTTLLPLGPPHINGKMKDVKFQDEERDKTLDTTHDSTLQNSVTLHRLTSLRLQQALIQNKPWNSQSEITDTGKEGRKQEDFHSDMSVDTATYDSGMGGSVSDTGDIRLAQLKQIVRQSGRRGQPPHKSHSSIPVKPPRVMARGRTDPSDIPPERPPPLRTKPYMSPPLKQLSPSGSPTKFTASSPTKFTTSSPTPLSMNQQSFISNDRNGAHSPTALTLPQKCVQLSPRLSPSRNVVNDLLMYKKFQNGLKPAHGRFMIDESVDTTQIDDDDSTTSGSYYIDGMTDDSLPHPPVSDIYV